MRLFDWMQEHALPRWWLDGADRDYGGFHEALDQQGLPVLRRRRARVAARQVYVFSAASRAGMSGPWREAAAHGLDFMLGRFIRPDGLIRAHLTPEGLPDGEDIALYDQAFCLFALGAAVRAGLGDDLLRPAERLLDLLERDWRAPGGGFVEQAPEAFQSNPHMHLFEAAMMLEAAGGGPRYVRLADAIAELALTRFIDPATGALREFFTADWRPADGPAGKVVEPGHQFEWAWLLTNWGVCADGLTPNGRRCACRRSP